MLHLARDLRIRVGRVAGAVSRGHRVLLPPGRDGGVHSGCGLDASTEYMSASWLEFAKCPTPGIDPDPAKVL